MGKTCAVPGCDRRDDRMVRGLCNRHYARWRRHGDPEAGAAYRDFFHPATCTIEGCERVHEAHGLCSIHYARQRRHGDAEVKLRHKNPRRAFLARVKRGPNCWEWTGGTTKAGYGALNVGGVTTLAHRFAFDVYVGRPAKEGMDVHHECGNRLCVNPDHLQEMEKAAHSRLHGKEA